MAYIQLETGSQLLFDFNDVHGNFYSILSEISLSLCSLYLLVSSWAKRKADPPALHPVRKSDAEEMGRLCKYRN